MVKSESHTCNICNKDYKTYKSMWHHKNKYHSYIPIHPQNIPTIPPIYPQNIPNIVKKTEQTICDYCNKKMSSYKNLNT